MFLPVRLIRPRHDDTARGNFGVIGDQNATFARVHQFVGLKAEAADLADGADILAMPFGAKAMGGVFDHGNLARIAKCHDRIHIRGMAAHMADQNLSLIHI